MAKLTDTDSLIQAHAYRLTRVSRLLRRSLISELSRLEIGLSPEQYFLVWRLHERDGRVQGELVDPLMDDRPNITRLLDGLAKKGLVERRRDPEDGRRWRVFLTAAGRALVERLLPEVVTLRHQLLGGISEADLAALERVMDHLESVLA